MEYVESESGKIVIEIARYFAIMLFIPNPLPRNI